ncbi:MAG: Ribosomal protein [Pseudomonadota bacterium]|jgi:ribosomal protein L18
MLRVKRKKALLKIRSKFGCNNKVELLVLKTSKNLYLQINDLSVGNTVMSCSTISIDGCRKNIAGAKKIAEFLANQYLQSSFKDIKPVFNRADYLFHGVVKQVADTFFEVINNNK